MTLKQSLTAAIKILEKNKILSPAMDAEILLSFVIKKPKEFLYAHFEKKLTEAQILKFKKLIARRARHEPVAYITGQKFFYGLDFFVNKNVLIPRPETETLVDETINQFKSKILNHKSIIIDVGTGSSAIAVSLAKNFPKTKIFATEISLGAINVARKNIKHHKVAVELLRGDLLTPTIKKLENCKLKIENLLIVANLPYLTTSQWQKTRLEIKKYEPRLALDGGKDGLKYYKQLLKQIKFLISHYSFPVTSIFEIDPSQKTSIIKLIKHYSPAAKIKIKKDLAERDRLVIFKV